MRVCCVYTDRLLSLVIKYAPDVNLLQSPTYTVHALLLVRLLACRANFFLFTCFLILICNSNNIYETSGGERLLWECGSTSVYLCVFRLPSCEVMAVEKYFSSRLQNVNRINRKSVLKQRTCIIADLRQFKPAFDICKCYFALFFPSSLSLSRSHFKMVVEFCHFIALMLVIVGATGCELNRKMGQANCFEFVLFLVSWNIYQAHASWLSLSCHPYTSYLSISTSLSFYPQFSFRSTP